MYHSSPKQQPGFQGTRHPPFSYRRLPGRPWMAAVMESMACVSAQWHFATRSARLDAQPKQTGAPTHIRMRQDSIQPFP
ncbi:unnamed protein product [Periconia digitata]|uniref:Uncharacterized protein n=1 Tax=Periconia digitata TaxID=1303443 RepID=A0A9W4UF90_9PLEO|nr:unnamed protein product [Periconia digitata]